MRFLCVSLPSEDIMLIKSDVTPELAADLARRIVDPPYSIVRLEKGTQLAEFMGRDSFGGVYAKNRDWDAPRTGYYLHDRDRCLWAWSKTKGLLESYLAMALMIQGTKAEEPCVFL